MIDKRLLTALALLGALIGALSAPAAAADDRPLACLTKAEQRAAIAAGEAVPLAAAIRSARGSVRRGGAREVVRARLCRQSERLVYLLTVLARDGKVSRVSVDATTGTMVSGR
jgi:uncharacterized membrane protein YkoI